MLSHGAKHTSDPERNLPQFEGLESRVLLTTLTTGDMFIYRDSNGHLVRVELESVDVTGLGRQTGVGQVELMKWVGAAPAGDVFDMPGRLNGVSVVPDMFGEGITGGWLDGADWNTGLSAVTAMGSFSTTQVWAYDRVTKGVYVINPVTHAVVAATMSLIPNQNVYSMAAVPPLLGVRTAMLFIWGTHKYTYLPPGATQPVETTITGMFRYNVVGNTATHIPVPDPDNPGLTKPAVETQGTPLPILTWDTGQSTLYGTDGTILYTVDGMAGGLSDPFPFYNTATGTAVSNVTGLSVHGGVLYGAGDNNKLFTIVINYNDRRADCTWVQTTGRTHGAGGGPGPVHGLFSTGTAPADPLYDFVRDGNRTLVRTVNAHPTRNADIFSIYINQADRYTTLTITPISENWDHRVNTMDWVAPLTWDVLLYDNPTFPPLPDFQRPLVSAMHLNPPPNPNRVVDIWATTGSGSVLIGGTPFPTVAANPDQNVAVGIVDPFTTAASLLGVFPGGSLYAGIAMPDAMPPDPAPHVKAMDMGRILVVGTVAGRVQVTGSLDVFEAGAVWGDVRVGYDANNIIVHTDYGYGAPGHWLNNAHNMTASLFNALVDVGGTLREMNVWGNMYGEVNVVGSTNLARETVPADPAMAPYADYNAEPIWEMEHKPYTYGSRQDPFYVDGWPNALRRHWTTHGELVTVNNDLKVPHPAPALPPLPEAAFADAQYLYTSERDIMVWGTLGTGGYTAMDIPNSPDGHLYFYPPDPCAAPDGVDPPDYTDTYALTMMAGQTIVLDARTADFLEFGRYPLLYFIDGHMTDRRLGDQTFTWDSLDLLNVHRLKVELMDAGGQLMGSVGWETVEDYRGGTRLGNGGTQEPLTFTAPGAGLYYVVVTALEQDIHGHYTPPWAYSLFIDNATPASLGALRVKGNLAPLYTLLHDNALVVKAPERFRDIAVQNGNLGAVEVTGTASGFHSLVMGNHDYVSIRAGTIDGATIVSDSNIGLVHARTGLLNGTVVAGARDDQCNDDADIQNIISAGDLMSRATFAGRDQLHQGIWSSGSIGVVEVGGTVWGTVDFRVDGNSTKDLQDSWGGRLDMLHVRGDWGGSFNIGVPTLTHVANSDIGMVKIDGEIWIWLAGDPAPRWLQPVSGSGSPIIDDDGGARFQISTGVQVDAQGQPLMIPDPNDATKMIGVPGTFEYYVLPVGDGSTPYPTPGSKAGGVLTRVNLLGPATMTNLSGGNVMDIGHLNLTGFGNFSIGYGGSPTGQKGGVNVYYVNGTNVDAFSNTTPGGAVVSGDFTTSLKVLEVKGNLGRFIGAAGEWVPGNTLVPGIPLPQTMPVAAVAQLPWLPTSIDPAFPTQYPQMGWYASRVNGVSITGDLGRASIGGWLGDLVVSGNAPSITVNSDRATAAGGFDGVVGVVHTGGDLGTIDVGDGLKDDGSGAWPMAGIFSNHNIGTVSISGPGHVLDGAVLAIGDPAGLRIPNVPEPIAAIGAVRGTGGAILTALIASPSTVARVPPGPSLEVWQPTTGMLVPSGWIGTISFSGPGAAITGAEVFGANIGKIEATAGSNGIDHSFFTGARVAANLRGIAQALADGPGISNSMFMTNGGRIGDVRGTGPASDVRLNMFDSTSGLDEVSGRDIYNNEFRIPGTIERMIAKRDVNVNIGSTIGSILNLQVGGDFAGNVFAIASKLQNVRIGGKFYHSTLDLHGPEGSHLGVLDVVGSISGTITVAGSIGTIRSKDAISASITTVLDPASPISPDVGEITAAKGFTGELTVAGNLGKFTCYTSLGLNPETIPNHVPKRIDIAGNLGILKVTPATKGQITNLYTAFYVGGSADTIDVYGALAADVTINGYLKNLILNGDMGYAYPDWDGDGQPDVGGNLTVYGAIEKIALAPGASIVGNLTTGATIKSLVLSDKTGDPARGNIQGNVTTLNGSIENVTVTGGSILGNLTSGGKIGKVTVKGTKGTAKTPGERGDVSGDITSKRGGIDALTITDGDLLGNVDAQGGDLLLLMLTNGSTQPGNRLRAYGSIGSLVVKNGKMAANVEAGVRLDKLDLTAAAGDPDALTGNLSVGTEAKSLKVKGNINGSQLDFYGTLTALGVTGDLNNVRLFTYGDMGDIAVTGKVKDSAVVGGFKDIAAPDPDLVHSSNLKSISAGSWENSTIALGVDPVNGTFGDVDDVPAPGTSTLGKMTLKTVPAVGGLIVTDTGLRAPAPAGMAVVRVDQAQPPLDPGGFQFSAATKVPAPDGTLIKLAGPGQGSYTVATGQIVLLNTTAASKLDISKVGADKTIHVLAGDDAELGGLTFKGAAKAGNLELDGAIGTLSAEQVSAAPTWNLPGGVKQAATPGVDGATITLGSLGAWTLGGSLTGGSLTADAIGDLKILGNTKVKPPVLGDLNTSITTTLGAIKNLVITGDVGVERPANPITITAHSGLAAFSARNVYGDVLVEKGDIGLFSANGNVGSYNDDDSLTVGNVEVPAGYIKAIKITNGSFGPPNSPTAIRSLTGIGSFSLQGPKVGKRPSSGGVISTNGTIGSITVLNAVMSSRVRAGNGILSVTASELRDALLASGGDITKIVVKEADPKSPVKGDVANTYVLAGFDPADAGFEYRTNVSGRDVYVDVARQLAFVAGGAQGLQIFDVSDPFKPFRVGGYNTAGEACAVYVFGNTAYVADGTAGFQIIDVTNAANPARLGGFDTAGAARDVYVSGATAYVADDDAGLQIFDVTDPANPSLLGGFDTAGQANGLYVDVANNLVYVADGDAGFQVIDVTDPANPVLAGGLNTTGTSRSVYVSGTTAYVADDDSGLQIIDVTNPAIPATLGRYATNGQAYDVSVTGTLAFVATDYDAGLEIVDVSNPAAPAPKGVYSTSRHGMGVFVDAANSLAYLADWRAGLQIISIDTDTTKPVLRSPVRWGAPDLRQDEDNVRIDGQSAVKSWRNFDGDATNDTPNADRLSAGSVVSVEVAGNMSSSSIVAGAGPGMDGYYGRGDPQQVQAAGHDTGADDQLRGAGYVWKVVVAGQLDGSSSDAEHYAILSASGDLMAIGGLPTSLVPKGAGYVKFNPASPLRHLSIGSLTTWGGNPRVASVQMSDSEVTIRFAHPIDFSTIVTPQIDPTRATAFSVIASVDSDFTTAGDNTVITDALSAGGLPTVLSYDEKTNAVTLRLSSGSWASARNPVTNLPIGTNYLVTLNSDIVLDRHGNKLDGEYVGRFPSGNGLVVQNGEPDFTYRLTYGDADAVGGTTDLSLTDPPQGTPGTPPFAVPPILWTNQVLTIYGRLGDNAFWSPLPPQQKPLPEMDLDVYMLDVQPGDIVYAWTSSLVGYLITPNTATLQASLSGFGYQATSAGTVDVSVAFAGYLGPYTLNVLKFNDGNSNFGFVPNAVSVSGNLAFVAGGGQGLQILDVTNPVNPLLQGVYPSAGEAYGVYVAGNLAYVADGTAGLQIVNVTDPANPVRQGGYDTAGVATGVYVVGNTAYVSDGTAGLQIIDVTDPANPVFRGAYDTAGTAQGVYVVGNLAYVADGAAGLQIVDVTVPANPVLQGELDTAGTAQGLYVVGNLAYVADGAAGLQVIDVTDPANPVLQGGFDTAGSARNVYVAGNLAYVADSQGGMQIVDVTDPANPVLAGGLTTPGAVNGVYVVGNLAYLTAGWPGFQIVDVTDPANPALLGGNDINVADDSTQHPTVIDWNGNVAQPAESDQEILAPDDIDVFALGDPNDPTTLMPKYTRLTLELETALIGSRMTPKMAVFNSKGDLVGNIFFGEEPLPRTDIGKVTVDVTLRGSVLLPADDHYYVAISGMVPRDFADLMTTDRDIGPYKLTVTKTDPPAGPLPAFPTQRVYLDFKGDDAAFLKEVFGPRTDTRQTALTADLFGFDPSQTENLRLIVKDTIKQIFSNSVYKNIVFYTNPPSGDYSTVYIGGNEAPVAGLLGVAETIDTQNSSLHDDAVVFGGDVAALYNVFDPLYRTNPNTGLTYTLQEIGQVLGNIAAHELAHVLGLQNVQNDFLLPGIPPPPRHPDPPVPLTWWLMGSDMGPVPYGRALGYWAHQQRFQDTTQVPPIHHAPLMKYPYAEFLIGYQNSVTSLWPVTNATP